MRRGVAVGAIKTVGAAVLALFLATASAPASAESRSDREIEGRLLAHIKVLAGDDFGGREPGTDGEAKTLRYLGQQWYGLGLVSGTNDPGNEWFSPVTLVAREPASGTARFMRKGSRTVIAPSNVLVLTSGKRSLVRAAPLLFVGNGRGLDFTRNELAGRVAVVLDGEEPDDERQTQLLAMGASAVLTVLDGRRTLDQVTARRQRLGYALADDSPGGDLEAFITRKGLAALLEGTSHSLEELETLAAEPDFVPVTLDLVATMEASTREAMIHTHNLIGKLPGRRPDAGAVLFVAHWDHFGVCGEPTAEDRICNGAVDNASGVAALTEIARRLARGPRLDRDVYFLATTAEELGLLGAHAFAENPPLPLTKIVAAFNIDSIAVAPKDTPFAIVGEGMTSLDGEIAKVARAEKLKLRRGEEANEFVKRQDGWALLQHDIPTVMVTTAYGEIERMRAFYDGDYHRPGDDLAHPIELGGAAQDVKMLTALGRWFADLRKVPANFGAGGGRGKGEALSAAAK